MLELWKHSPWPSPHDGTGFTLYPMLPLLRAGGSFGSAATPSLKFYSYICRPLLAVRLRAGAAHTHNTHTIYNYVHMLIYTLHKGVACLYIPPIYNICTPLIYPLYRCIPIPLYTHYITLSLAGAAQGLACPRAPGGIGGYISPLYTYMLI